MELQKKLEIRPSWNTLIHYYLDQWFSKFRATVTLSEVQKVCPFLNPSLCKVIFSLQTLSKTTYYNRMNAEAVIRN